MRALPLLLLMPAVSRAAEIIYPIWDEENYVELYAREVAKDQIILICGGVPALLLLGVVVFQTVRNRKRFRFSLSWLLAFVFALSVALWGGVGWWVTPKPDTYDERFHAAFESAMKTPTNVDVDYVLSWVGAKGLAGRGVYVVLSPELEKVQKKISLKLQGVSGRDAINQACRLIGAGCDVRNRALLLYPEGKRPPIRKRFIPKEEWEIVVAQKFTRKASIEMCDSPASEAFNFIASLLRTKTVVAPDTLKNDPLISMGPVADMRLDDMLTWFCLLSDTEWSLRKAADGSGEIWIAPQSESVMKGLKE